MLPALVAFRGATGDKDKRPHGASQRTKTQAAKNQSGEVHRARQARGILQAEGAGAHLRNQVEKEEGGKEEVDGEGKGSGSAGRVAATPGTTHPTQYPHPIPQNPNHLNNLNLEK